MLERQKVEPELVVRDKGLSGKKFFQSQEAKGLQVAASRSVQHPYVSQWM